MPRNVLTLMDKIERAKQTGLAQKPVQELAADAGRSTPASTAVETGVLGGTPQQQAMAGTPAQKKAALAPTKIATALPQETELEQAQVLGGPAEETAEDIAKKEKAKQFATSLGTFGAKVSEWVEAAKNKITGTKAQVQVEATDKLLAGLPANKKTDAMDLIKKIANAYIPQTKTITVNGKSTTVTVKPSVDFGGKKLTIPEAELQLNAILGKDAEHVLTPEEKQAMYADVQKSMSAAVESGQTAALGADRKLTLSDLSTLGTTQEEVATLLGIPPTDVGNLTITQLQQKISEESQKAFGTTQQIQAGLASTALSSADRAALRQYLRGVEQTGVAGAEAAVASLAQDIDRGRQVKFGDKVYAVEELLESTALNDLVKQVLSDPTGPIATELAKSEPDFANWITSNKDGLNKLVSQSAEASKSFGELQKQNIAALGEIGKTQPELAKALGYDPKKLQATALDPKKLPGAFQSIAAISDPGEQTAAAAALATINKVSPGEVGKLTKEQVDNLDLTNPEGAGAQYVQAVNAQKRADKLQKPEDVLAEYSAEDMSVEDVNDALTGDALATALGLPLSSASELDINKDGKFDAKDVPGIKQKITSDIPTLAEVANGAYPTTTRDTFKLEKPVVKGIPGEIYTSILPKVREGEPITAEDFRQNNWPLETLNQIIAGLPQPPLASPTADGILGQVRGSLQTLVDEYVAQQKAAEEEAERQRLAEEERQRELAKPELRREHFRDIERKRKEVTGGPKEDIERRRGLFDDEYQEYLYTTTDDPPRSYGGWQEKKKRL